MLPKRLKLSLRQELDFFKTAQRLHSLFFSIYYQTDVEQLQLSVIVPKKNVKKATARNKNKRLLYNLVSKTQNKFPACKMVLVLKKDLSQLSTLVLEKELENQLAKIIKNS